MVDWKNSLTGNFRNLKLQITCFKLSLCCSHEKERKKYVILKGIEGIFHFVCKATVLGFSSVWANLSASLLHLRILIQKKNPNRIIPVCNWSIQQHRFTVQGSDVKCPVDTRGSATSGYCTLDGMVSQLLFQTLLMKQSDFRTVPFSEVAVEKSGHSNSEKQ